MSDANQERFMRTRKEMAPKNPNRNLGTQIATSVALALLLIGTFTAVELLAEGNGNGNGSPDFVDVIVTYDEASGNSEKERDS